MNAQDYPVTTPFGQVAGYPLNNGFHNGIDYGCPVGTPVVVNGVRIGLSGNTGYSTGPHLHVGRWLNGQATDPAGGFSFNSAVVTECKEDATNGKYVRVQADGASWVYLHMSDNTLVSAGQELKGDDMALQADLDIANYKLSESENALRSREAQADVLQYKLNESEKALRAREAQATEYENEIAALKVLSGQPDSEANIVGKALIKLLATLGYKKG